MVYITRKETFSAAHKLSRSDWDENKNREVFGKCANPNWHGHNYELTVTVKGEVNPETGFVANLSVIGQILKSKIIDKIATATSTWTWISCTANCQVRKCLP